LINGQLDFCTIPLHPINPELEYEVIHQEEIFLAVPKHHPVNSQITPSPGFSYIDLRLVKNEPFIALKSVQKFSQMSIRMCEEAGFTPNVILETLNWDTVNLLVAKGLGVGFVPEILVNSASRDENQPNYYRILSTRATRPYAIAYSKGKTPFAAAQILMDYFRDAFRSGIHKDSPVVDDKTRS
jgi:LysR family hydrogen peroxide-inducible transcriptional activator